MIKRPKKVQKIENGYLSNERYQDYAENQFKTIYDYLDGYSTFDGKEIKRQYIKSTVGEVQSLINSFGVYRIITMNLYARSNYNRYFKIPTYYPQETQYDIDYYQAASGEVRLYFGSFYSSGNEVYGYIEYI
jgi:hypothetical protein